MSRSLARIKGLGFILWHARHMFYHILLGLAWAWLLRELWQEFNLKWVLISVLGSLLPDADHFFYFFTYGRKDPYILNIKKFLRDHQWRIVTVFMEKGHKHNTNLAFHNIYVILLLFIVVSICFMFDRNSWVVFFGAMVIHYIFDIFDDLITLGRINPNWKRWGRGKTGRYSDSPSDFKYQ